MKEERKEIRLNKYLAEQKIASRREADRLIQSGQVKINGRPARLGDKVQTGDLVTLTAKSQERQKISRRYFAYHKPKDILTNADSQGKTIKNLVAKNLDTSLFPLGRLDKSSRGLIILTNDGRLTERLLSPAFDHEKEYRLVVDKALTPMFQKAITGGVEIEGYRTKPARLKKISPTEFSLTLTEGKKHQLRRMCAALGYQVKDLLRTRIMNIKLGSLKAGQVRPLEGPELLTLLQDLGLQ